MKKISRAVCLLLAAIMMFSITACTNRSTTLLTYEDMTFSAEEYSFALAVTKGYYIDKYLSNYSQDMSTNTEIWGQLATEDLTFAEVVNKETLDTAKVFLLTNYFCKKFDLSVTDEKTIENIDNLMEQFTTDFGGKDRLAIEIAQYGITVDQLREFYMNQARTQVLMDYWYGKDGQMKITDSEVQEKFLADYQKFDIMTYSYTKADDNQKQIPYYYNDITDEQAREYFNDKYVKVQHILFNTVDTDGEKLSDEEIKLAEKNANDAYNAIKSGEVTFDDTAKENNDFYEEYVFTGEEMFDEYKNAILTMKNDEIQLVKTDYGFYIIKKLATTDEDFTKKIELIKKKISDERTKTNADEMLAKLKNGEVEFKDGGEDAAYSFEDNNLYQSGYIKDLKFDKVINETKVGEYSNYDNGSYYYIIKKNEIKAEDLDTQDAGSLKDYIYNYLIEEAFFKYMNAQFDSVTVNQEELDKFDVVTAVPFRRASN